VDIFDQKGRYIDNFYLSFPGDFDLHSLYSNQICINKDNLFIRETDEEDNYIIVKYKIDGSAFEW
jgi:hypothetical protein